jgi:hypothetical protein
VDDEEEGNRRCGDGDVSKSMTYFSRFAFRGGTHRKFIFVSGTQYDRPHGWSPFVRQITPGPADRILLINLRRRRLLLGVSCADAARRPPSRRCEARDSPLKTNKNGPNRRSQQEATTSRGEDEKVPCRQPFCFPRPTAEGSVVVFCPNSTHISSLLPTDWSEEGEIRLREDGEEQPLGREGLWAPSPQRAAPGRGCPSRTD